jgi:hypothetical protein
MAIAKSTYDLRMAVTEHTAQGLVSVASFVLAVSEWALRQM